MCEVLSQVACAMMLRVARRLLDEKTGFREAGIAAWETHLARLREGHHTNVEASALHIDILRDRKRIRSHICATAYPVLEGIGELLSSRREVAARRTGTEVKGRHSGDDGPATGPR